MKISKITQVLLIASVFAVVFNLARLDLFGTTNLFYLIWNLFLAWVPYIISIYFIKKDTPVNLFIPLFILWLLFFPNAPYLVTDISHTVLSAPAILWYDSLLFFFFAWIGLILGMLSLINVHAYLKNHLSDSISELVVIAICFISSFGIYLGRFERWNSWDIFLSPFHLIKNSFFISAGFSHAGNPLIFVLVFSVFIYMAYKVVCILLTDKFGI